MAYIHPSVEAEYYVEMIVGPFAQAILATKALVGMLVVQMRLAFG
jgi:hypothetical protein